VQQVNFRRIVTAVFLLKPEGSALLQLRDDRPDIRHPGQWSIPGGHVDPPESTTDAARRELWEELHYHVGDLHFISVRENDDGDGDRYDLVLFWSPFDESQTIECLEGKELKWVALKEASLFLRPPLEPVLIPAWKKAVAELKKDG
jgi:8-oxo-dGTP pyrophosphatase MutT (NUDIX family)